MKGEGAFFLSLKQRSGKVAQMLMMYGHFDAKSKSFMLLSFFSPDSYFRASFYTVWRRGEDDRTIYFATICSTL